jgi:hypothetical protein
LEGLESEVVVILIRIVAEAGLFSSDFEGMVVGGVWEIGFVLPVFVCLRETRNFSLDCSAAILMDVSLPFDE